MSKPTKEIEQERGRLERIFRIFHDIKKELHYLKHYDCWVWTDRGEQIDDGYAGWKTALEAMEDACEPYMNNDDEESP